MKLKTDYCDNFIYENDSLKQTLVEGGYILYVYPQGTSPANQATDISQLTPTYHFYVRDHLGNNRLVMNENGTIEQVSHYYPFGGLMGESRDITSTHRYRYNGKELDRMHGLDWYDYGARHYDASIGRWMCVDPLAEKYHGISPYAYCANNPTNAFDPDGRVVVPVPVITGTIGGVLGFAGNLVSQAIDGDLDLLSKKTWKRAGAATIAGAVAGATCNVGGIFIASTAGDVADQSIKNDGDLSKTNLTQAAANGIVSIVGAGAAKVLAKGAAGRTVANQIGKQFKPKATDALTSYIKTGKTSSRLTREKIATTIGAVLGGMTEKVANITTNNYLLPKDQDFVKDVLLKPISYGSDKSWSKSQSTIKTPLSNRI